MIDWVSISIQGALLSFPKAPPTEPAEQTTQAGESVRSSTSLARRNTASADTRMLCCHRRDLVRESSLWLSGESARSTRRSRRAPVAFLIRRPCCSRRRQLRTDERRSPGRTSEVSTGTSDSLLSSVTGRRAGGCSRCGNNGRSFRANSYCQQFRPRDQLCWSAAV